MIPLIAIILDIAKGVTTGVITDLIRDKKRAVERKELEERVTIEVLQRLKGDQVYLQFLARRVIDEIEILSSRDPDLAVTLEGIQLAQRTRLPFLRTERYVNRQLTEKLRNLDQIILQRREQLGLSPQSQQFTSLIREQVPTESDRKESLEGWHQQEREDISKWESEIQQMLDRIKVRRSP